MYLRKFRLCCRPVAPTIVGLCLGITFSLLYAPFLDEQGCTFLKSEDKKQQIKLRETKSFHELQERSAPHLQNALNNNNNNNMNSGIVAARGSVQEGPKKLEPRLKLQGQGNPLDPVAGGVPGGGIKVHKLVRPRYISTELGIREKLFVAVLTSPESLDTLAVAMNKSVAHHVTKMVFFTGKKSSPYPGSGMSIVGFSLLSAEQHLLPLFILKYLGEHYASAFDYYMFVSDKTYLRGEKIFDMVSEISISEDVHFGAELPNQQGTCTLDGGIIISQSVLNKSLAQLQMCFKNKKKVNSMDLILESCIVQGSALHCENSAGDQLYKYAQVSDFDYQDVNILQDTKVKNSYVIAPIPDDISVYKLHKIFCQIDLNETIQEIERTKEEILYLSQFAPGGRKSLSWPIGLPAPFKPKNRFDVIHWQYFTATHLYFDSDYSNEKQLKGVNKLDVDEILSFSIKELTKRYKKRFSFSHLVNGYRRFDPFRGMEYILDLSMHDTQAHNAVIEKRVHLVRPLGQVEIIPMPYVTENTQVNLVLPVTEEDKDEFGSFLDAYAHTCLDTGDNTNLLIVFVYKNNSQFLKDDKFYVLKSMITYYDNKYMNKGKISWTKYETKDTYVSDLMVMDSITKRFSPDSLLLFCTVGMELTTDFFNRVRMNNIIGWQVFFPIAFWQYKPNLIYNKRPYPTTIELKRNVGHFDVYSYDHSSFYNKDFQNARKSLTWDETRKLDLFKMFLRQKKLHVFRAIEPTLKHRYKAINCDRTSPAPIYERCNKRKLEALANRPQLARLIFEYEEKMENQKRHNNPTKKSVILDPNKNAAMKGKDNKKVVH